MHHQARLTPIPRRTKGAGAENHTTMAPLPPKKRTSRLETRSRWTVRSARPDNNTATVTSLEYGLTSEA
jgi:hypothetical protein